MIFDALSNATYRASLRGPGAELGGGGQTPPARRVRRRARAPVNPAPPGVFPYPRPPGGGVGSDPPPAISKTVGRSEPGEAAFERARRVVP